MYTPPPPPDERLTPELLDDDSPETGDSLPPARPVYRGSSGDTTFGFLIALALAVGLSPILPEGVEMRYTLVWAVLAGFGVLAWLLGSVTRIAQETPEDLVWGITFGLIVAAPLLLMGGSTLSITVRLLFDAGTAEAPRPLPAGAVLAYLVFVMPLAETLFFRGLLQEQRAFWLVGLLSTLFSLVLFAPMLNITQFPGVAILIGVALLLVNMIYSYVRDRNGLAAAWLCQIVVNIVLLFVPYLSG
jgi:membrane protease YdiL (CAAX protease family)